MVDSPTLVLVHSPLLGPSTWMPTAESLRSHGYPVVVSSMSDAVDDDPPHYWAFATAAARAIGGTAGPVIVVGHSGAGALLPAITEVVGNRVHGAVFVDELLPHPGRNWLDTAASGLRERLPGLVRAGHLAPWNEWFPPEVFHALVPDAGMRKRFIAELPALPLAYFEEPAPITRDWINVRCAYVRLSEAYDPVADEAEVESWWVHREHADHLAILTQPCRAADVIARAAVAVVDA